MALCFSVTSEGIEFPYRTGRRWCGRCSEAGCVGIALERSACRKKERLFVVNVGDENLWYPVPWSPFIRYELEIMYR